MCRCWKMGQKGLNALDCAGNFRIPGGKNSTEWFMRHAPEFYKRLHEHMVRASDSIM